MTDCPIMPQPWHIEMSKDIKKMIKEGKNVKDINEPEKSLACPKCGGFVQYFKNVEVCRDCEFIIKTHPVDMSGELPEYIVVHVVDGRTKTKRIITADNEKEALDMMGGIILGHRQYKVTCSADAITSWDVGMYRKVS